MMNPESPLFKRGLETLVSKFGPGVADRVYMRFCRKYYGKHYFECGKAYQTNTVPAYEARMTVVFDRYSRLVQRLQ